MQQRPEDYQWRLMRSLPSEAPISCAVALANSSCTLIDLKPNYQLGLLGVWDWCRSRRAALHNVSEHYTSSSALNIDEEVFYVGTA